jgi:hypothetical protein
MTVEGFLTVRPSIDRTRVDDQRRGDLEVIPNCSEATPHAQSELWLISPDGERRRLRALPQ